MNIAEVLVAWCAVSVVVSLVFGQSVRRQEHSLRPVPTPSGRPVPAGAGAR